MLPWHMDTQPTLSSLSAHSGRRRLVRNTFHLTKECGLWDLSQKQLSLGFPRLRQFQRVKAQDEGYQNMTHGDVNAVGFLPKSHSLDQMSQLCFWLT